MQYLVRDLPCLSADLPKIHGTIKNTEEDFCVEEIPAYQPCGEGEHLFLWIEKQGVASDALIGHLSRTLSIPRMAIGCAGLKDKQAITRQFLSVPATCESRIASVGTDAIRVLHFAKHRNKLKTGHLKGNRFRIVVRSSGADCVERAEAIAERIQKVGVPNYYGEQRFGRDNETLRLGLDLLRTPDARRVAPHLLRLALSSVQSALFNVCLVERMQRGTLHQVLLGDVMQVLQSGGVFVCDNVEVDQTRFETREICMTGPMFGPKMKQPENAVFDFEQEVLRQAELTMQDFETYGKLTLGTRRAYLLWPLDLGVEGVDGGVAVSFTLPPGSYATVVMREFLSPAPFAK